MAVLQRVALYPNERYDTPDARAMEAFSQNDWRFFFSGIISKKSYVLSGFEITNYANIFRISGIRLRQNNAVIMHPEATTQAAGFYVAAGSEPDAQLQLSPNATNFVEIDFETSSGTPDTRAFWDMGANGGKGAEFTDEVDTVINLELKITSNTSSFSPGKIPLYKIITNPSGLATEVTDCRPLFFRLGTGGTSPNPSAEFSWPENSPNLDHAQFETPIKSVAAADNNAPFQGGDKNIKSLKEWMDAVMTSLMKLKGSPYWYSQSPSIGEVYQNAKMTLMVSGIWRHENTVAGKLSLVGGSTFYRIGKKYNCSLSQFSNIDMSSNPVLFIVLPDDSQITYRMGNDNSNPVSPKIVSGVSNNEIVVSGNGNYILTGGNLMIGSKIFSYGFASYNSVENKTTFTSITPDPTGLVKSGNFVYQSEQSVNGYYHYSQSEAVPGVNDSKVSSGVEKTTWIAFFDGVKIHTPDAQLEQGEQIQIGFNTSQAIISYIGSTGEADYNPVYDVNSITNGINLTAAITEAFKIIEKPIYDECIIDTNGSGWTAGSSFTLPLNSRAKPVTATVVGVDGGTIFVSSSQNFKETNFYFETEDGKSYSYTSYSKSQKKFTGVAPSPANPNSSISVGSKIIQNNTFGQYTQSTGELEVYENGVLWRPSTTIFGEDGDYQEISNNSIRTLRFIPPNSTIRFRIASVGGAGAAANNGLTGTTMQRAYSNGRTIVVQPEAPIEIIGADNGEIPFIIHDSLKVDKSVVSSSVELTPVESNPLNEGSVGLWVNSSTKKLQYTRPDGTILSVSDILEQTSGDYSQMTRTMQNGSQATIPAGSPVYITSAGKVGLASCASDMGHIFMGISASSIPPGSYGKIIYAGVVSGIFAGMGLNSGYVWLGSAPGALSLAEPENEGDYLVIVGLIDGEHLILQPQLNGQL